MVHLDLLKFVEQVPTIIYEGRIVSVSHRSIKDQINYYFCIKLNFQTRQAQLISQTEPITQRPEFHHDACGVAYVAAKSPDPSSSMVSDNPSTPYFSWVTERCSIRVKFIPSLKRFFLLTLILPICLAPKDLPTQYT